MPMRQQRNLSSPYTKRAALLAPLGVAAMMLSSLLPANAYAAAPAPHTSQVSTGAVGRTVVVSTVAALVSALGQAQPGDRIVVANGTYTLGTEVAITRSGTVDNPITIAAQTTGMVTLTGAAGLAINASYVTVQGFIFTNARSLEVPADQHHIRLTRNTFQLAQTVENWVSIAGDDCEIDHNLFQNKTQVGVFLQIIGPGSADMAKRTHIHHNEFRNHTFKGANGGESIRLGLSERQHGNAAALVEENYFENANGDPEAISVKSSDNTIRHNTIVNSRGTITLRHGWHNTVDGNVLIGGSTGIRVFGNDHTVVNNIIQDSTRDELIEVGGGSLRDDTNSVKLHEAVDRLLIGFNTLVTGPSGVALKIGDTQDAFAPDAVTIANNIVVGPIGAVQVQAGTHLTWRGNILSAGSTVVPADGFRAADPQLVKVDGIYRPSVGSPAIGTAVAGYDQVGSDIDEQLRPRSNGSVGADEFVGGHTRHDPASPALTGPDAP